MVPPIQIQLYSSQLQTQKRSVDYHWELYKYERLKRCIHQHCTVKNTFLECCHFSRCFRANGNCHGCNTAAVGEVWIKVTDNEKSIAGSCCCLQHPLSTLNLSDSDSVGGDHSVLFPWQRSWPGQSDASGADDHHLERLRGTTGSWKK